MYSLFFSDLRSRGHQLSMFHFESPLLSLKEYGENLYDNIVLFAPSAESFSSIGFDDITEFVQEGGNVLVAANKRVSDGVRDFMESFGLTIDKKETEVIDHFEAVDSLDLRFDFLMNFFLPSPYYYCYFYYLVVNMSFFRRRTPLLRLRFWVISAERVRSSPFCSVVLVIKWRKTTFSP